MSSLTETLLLHGIQIKPYSLLPGTTPIGETAVIDHSEITYRQEGNQLTVILYRRLKRVPGLGNAFKEMKWFINFIRTHVSEIKVLYTTAMNIDEEDSLPALPPEKLTCFYQRYFNAIEAYYLDDQLWLKLVL
ncbi:MAG: hypothetical protein P8X74_14915 [Reinekea sp.]|jgi:hypothetical protein